MKKNLIHYLIWAFCCLPIFVFSQSSNILDQYIDIALSNNLSLKGIQLAKEIQGSKVDQAKKLWQPNVDLAGSYLLAEGGRSIVFPVGDLFNPAYGAINRLSGTNDFPTDLENFETQLTPNNFIDASLAITKPIINSVIKYNIKIQEALIALNDFDSKIERQEIIFQVKQSYFNILKTVQARSIIEENITLLQEVKSFNEKLIKYNKATPDVISDVNYQIANLESQLVGLDQQRELSKVLFNTILNRNIKEEIEIDTSYFNSELLEVYDFDQLVTSAFDERSEFDKLELSKSINELNAKRIESGNQPTLNVRGAVGIQSEDFSFDDGGPLFTAGVSIGWNLWDGGLRKRQLEELSLKSLHIENEQLQVEQQIRLQVAQEFYNIQTLLANLEAENAAINAAAISYNAINKRYRNDKALLIELLSAQSNVSSSKLKKALVSIDLLIAQANLERITKNQ